MPRRRLIAAVAVVASIVACTATDEDSREPSAADAPQPTASDGGRVLRAFLGRRGDWVAATERAGVTIQMITTSFTTVAFLIDADDNLLYSHRDRGILGFSATMNRPLSSAAMGERAMASL